MERAALQPLPPRRTTDHDEALVTVTRSGGFLLRRVFYTVPSCLIGHRLRVRLYDDRLECLLGTTLVATLPRGRPAHDQAKRTVHVVDYHHVIQALRRKPGALLNLVYRDQLFPRDAYRQAWDVLTTPHPARIACRIMVGLLELAHDRGCEATLAVELERILATGALPELDVLRQQFVATDAALPDVTVILQTVASYDALLTAGTCMAAGTGAAA